MNTHNSSELLEAIEVNPSQEAVASFIWLHGLGASGNDFVPIAAELQQRTNLPLRFLFPHAPERPITINHGFIMPAWYDISSFDKEGDIDHEGISISVAQVRALIHAEKKRGFHSHKIFLAGFSQGAVIVLNTLLSTPEDFGGLIALSGYLPPREIQHHQRKTPVFLGHGQNDEIVLPIYGQAVFETLKKAGYPVTWKTYPMTHSVCDQEIRDLAEWLTLVLPRQLD